MKAEHRKELETNVLADRMGRAIQSMKHRPRKRTVLWVIIIGGLLIGWWVWMRSKQLAREENSIRWLTLGVGDFNGLRGSEKNNAILAANFESAWYALWEEGIKNLAKAPDTTLIRLEALKEKYEQLATMAKDDPVLLPEALYAIAVIDETRAIRDRKYLEEALSSYHLVADKHKDSAFGKLALDRIEILEDSAKRAEVANFYNDLYNTWHDRIKEVPLEKRFGKDLFPPQK